MMSSTVLQEEHRAGSVPVCATCQSELVVKDAWAIWNSDSGMWEVLAVFDRNRCEVCDAETTVLWSRPSDRPVERIRALNDALRKTGSAENGFVVATKGVVDLGPECVRQIMEAVRDFDDFSPDNDPYAEHDFGAIELFDRKIFWKIDYCDLSLTKGSPNPANPMLTKRILTFMLAEEY